MRAASRTCAAKPGKNSVSEYFGATWASCLCRPIQARRTRKQHGAGEDREIAAAGIREHHQRQRARATAPAQRRQHDRQDRHQQRHQRDIDEGEAASQRVDVLAQIVLHVAKLGACIDQLAAETLDLRLLCRCETGLAGMRAAALLKLVQALLQNGLLQRAQGRCASEGAGP